MFPVPDGFAFLFLVLFLIGLLFVVVSALMGFGSDLAHATGIHLPGTGGDSADVGHDLGHSGHSADFSGHSGDTGHVGHSDGGTAGAHTDSGSYAHSSGHAATGSHTANGGHAETKVTTSASPFNLMTLMTFITWFGGAGYILYALASWPLLFSLIGAAIAGIVGGWLVYLLLVKFFLAGAVSTDPSAREVIGSIAKVTISVTKDVPGEIVYTLDGSRHSDGARSVDGLPIPRGTEVVIVRFERGIAYVQPWTRFVEDAKPYREPQIEEPSELQPSRGQPGKERLTETEKP